MPRGEKLGGCKQFCSPRPRRFSASELLASEAPPAAPRRRPLLLLLRLRTRLLLHLAAPLNLRRPVVFDEPDLALAEPDLVGGESGGWLAGWLGRRCSRGKCFREQIKSEEKRGSLLVLNRAAQIRCSLFVTQLAASSANRCFGRAQQAAAAAAEKCCMQMMIVCRCLL